MELHGQVFSDEADKGAVLVEAGLRMRDEPLILGGHQAAFPGGREIGFDIGVGVLRQNDDAAEAVVADRARGIVQAGRIDLDSRTGRKEEGLHLGSVILPVLVVILLMA